MMVEMSQKVFSNRERRRFNNKRGRKMEVLASNEILASKSPVGIKDVFKMVLGMSRV
jgi:hypothetical protein